MVGLLTVLLIVGLMAAVALGMVYLDARFGSRFYDWLSQVERRSEEQRRSGE